MIKLTGLWKSKDKNGNEYFGGSINSSARMMIFANTHKSSPKEPDMIAYVVPNEREQKPEEKREDDISF